ncbi:MAG TPA: SsrA-binding protein SmpB [Pirellulaceae bacterium]|nr:SsrA-binding protein SmpB [Pirellulaceae bacterium]HMO90772.1 SsrA-binding protein SmpB [Pirellulaceae bacterium]HMP68023.1 SsrA-binding protein SmpB [Pirellulaceae bacterium]
MAKKKDQSKSTAKPKNDDAKRMVGQNRKATHRYEIIEKIECGLVLHGSEVKSLRDGHLSLDEAYVRYRDNELWLVGAEISEYRQASIWNHDAKRARKLLVHKRQLGKLAGRAMEKGLTLVPLQLYFSERGIAKVLVGVGRGKKLHDKRQSLKDADTKRHLDRAKKHYDRK